MTKGNEDGKKNQHQNTKQTPNIIIINKTKTHDKEFKKKKTP